MRVKTCFFAVLAALLLLAAQALAAPVPVVPPMDDASDQEVLSSLSSSEKQTLAIREVARRKLLEALPQLRVMLEASPEHVRLQVANTLWILGDRRGAQVMRKAISQPHSGLDYFVMDAIKLLSADGDAEALKAAWDYFRAGNPSERRLALEALAGAPADAGALYDVLEKGMQDPATVRTAARLLGVLKTARAAELLAKVDYASQDIGARIRLACATADVGRWRTVPLLFHGLSDSEQLIYESAAMRLMDIPKIPHPWRAAKDGLAPSTAMQPVEEAPGPGDLELYTRLKEDPKSRKLYARLLLDWWEQNKSRFDLDAEVPKPKEAKEEAGVKL